MFSASRNTVREAIAIHEAAEIHAMIDLSDGLSSDLGHILEESEGMGAILYAESIPIHADAIDAASQDGTPALDHALHDGEDFELCLVVSPEAAQALPENLDRSPQLEAAALRAAEEADHGGIGRVADDLLAPVRWRRIARPM